MKYSGILWDCDGVLIDSEWIACGLAAEMLSEAGYPISTEEFVLRFCGQGKKHIYQTIQNESGTDFLPLLENANKHTRQRQAFKDKLELIEGIVDVLDNVTVPMAIASGSGMDRLEYTLQLTDLYDRFAGRIYNSDMVEKGKPHPDVFLFAANEIKVAPEHCLVIEDSHNGVRAGKAAGMTVFGFTGGTHILDKKRHEQELRDLGADLVFHAMHELPDLMRA